ncbi:MAG: DMT family transporter [Theionarchaea archaeon]|nr:DMT family transporter [Theionarchaea archaeon]MBU7021285.1 DMT family transporter [Theionarchaea archaeon]MBU7041449.1 DMT family transporter [Theionarchaea archaeon]
MNKGMVLAGTAGVLWGTIPLAVKQVYATGSATALEMSFFRFVIAAVLVGGLARTKKQPILLRNKWSVLMGFWGVFWMSFISFYGINYTSAVNATILFNSNPLLVAVLVMGLRWETVTARTLAGVVLGIAGVVVVSGLRADIHLLGDLLVLIGAFGWAVYTVLGYKLKEHSSLTVTSSSLFWGLPFFMTFFREVPAISNVGWLWILYIGLIPTAFAFACYIKAVDLIGSTHAAVFQYLAPVVAVIVSVACGLEEVTLLQVAGVVMIIGGIELVRSQ